MTDSRTEISTNTLMSSTYRGKISHFHEFFLTLYTIYFPSLFLCPSRFPIFYNAAPVHVLIQPCVDEPCHGLIVCPRVHGNHLCPPLYNSPDAIWQLSADTLFVSHCCCHCLSVCVLFSCHSNTYIHSSLTQIHTNPCPS